VENEICGACAGSGEGMYSDSTCRICCGSGTLGCSDKELHEENERADEKYDN